jgi:AcrR family transcriptional regulator
MRPSSREAILDAAFRLADHDPGAIPITFEAVAAEAGVTKAGVQYHFRSRRELILATMDYVARRVEGAMEDVLAKPLTAATPAERVGAYVDVIAAGQLTRGDLAVFAESLVDPAYSVPWAAVVESWLDVQGITDPAVRLRVTVARLAADGLWLAEAINISHTAAISHTALSPGSDERAAVVAHLRSLTKELA